MNKKIFIGFVIISLSLIISNVSAANIDAYLSKTSSSVCPCSTVSDISLVIANHGTFTDTYDFSLELPGGWSGFIQPHVTLSPGEATEIKTLYVTPTCYVESGKYTVNVIAVSGSTGEKASNELSVEVLKCYDVKIFAPEQKETCKNTPVKYIINIANYGKYKETFDVSASASWGQLLQTSLTIEPEATIGVELSVDPPKDLVGLQDITITAKSQTSHAEAKKVVKLDIKNCYDFNIDLQPKENAACLGKSVNYRLMITNIGLKNDTYYIITPDWVLPDVQTILLSPNERKEINLVVTPHIEGKSTFDVYVASSENPELKKGATGGILSDECRSVAVIISPSYKSVCRGFPVSYEISIKNMGTVEDVFDLSASFGDLEQNKVVLGPGEIKIVKLNVNTAGLESGMSKNITVKATDGKVSDENTIVLNAKNCYSASVELKPESLSVCQNEDVSFEAIVKNTGELGDNYTFYFENKTSPEEFYLGPGQSKTFTLKEFKVTYPQDSKQTIIARLYSLNIALEKSLSLDIKSHKDCYSVQLSADESARMVKIGESFTFKIKIKNTGDRSDKYSVNISGPAWTYLKTTDHVSLNPDQEGELYLYVSPPYETQLGAYIVTVNVASSNSNAELKIVANAVSDGGVTPTPNATENVSLNITIPTGSLFEFHGISARTIIIGIIALVIIVILIVRFIFLMR
jgi:uncharacterized membrane protein